MNAISPKLNPRVIYYCLIVLLWCLAITSRYFYNGLVYGFDFGIYQPDGIFYSLRTLRWLGYSDLGSAIKVSQWYQQYSAKNLTIAPESLMHLSPEVWGLIAPRILYPLLSLPFVWLLGIKGMLVVPALSLLLFLICVYKICETLKQETAGIFLVLIFSTLPTILRWTVANITDSLLLGLFALVTLCLLRIGSSKWFRYLLLILVIFANLTRFSFPMWFGISLIIFISISKKFGVTVFFVNIISTIPTFLFQPKTAFLPLEQNATALDKIFKLPFSFIKVGFYEIAELAVLDRMLLSILIFAFAGAVVNWREIESQYFFVVLIAVWALGAINGNIGVNFRYQLPLIPFAVIPFIKLLLKLGNRSFRDIRNVIS